MEPALELGVERDARRAREAAACGSGRGGVVGNEAAGWPAVDGRGGVIVCDCDAIAGCGAAAGLCAVVDGRGEAGRCGCRWLVRGVLGGDRTDAGLDICGVEDALDESVRLD